MDIKYAAVERVLRDAGERIGPAEERRVALWLGELSASEIDRVADLIHEELDYFRSRKSNQYTLTQTVFPGTKEFDWRIKTLVAEAQRASADEAKQAALSATDIVSLLVHFHAAHRSMRQAHADPESSQERLDETVNTAIRLEGQISKRFRKARLAGDRAAMLEFIKCYRDPSDPKSFIAHRIMRETELMGDEEVASLLAETSALRRSAV